MLDERLCWMPATELAGLVRKKQVSPVEVVDAVLARIERVNPTLGAFVTVTGEEARRASWRDDPGWVVLPDPEVQAGRYDDVTVLRASAAYERARPWAQHRPPPA